MDSNHRSYQQQIYSLPPLATRELSHVCILFPAKRTINIIQEDYCFVNNKIKKIAVKLLLIYVMLVFVNICNYQKDHYTILQVRQLMDVARLSLCIPLYKIIVVVLLTTTIITHLLVPSMNFNEIFTSTGIILSWRTPTT